MCPACIANAALIVTGAVSAGGWTAFALRKPRARSGGEPDLQTAPRPEPRDDSDPTQPTAKES
jgi:hypothetical protein